MGFFKERKKNNNIKVVMYTRDEIKRFVDDVIKIMSGCKIASDIKNVYNNIREKIKDDDLSFELYSFIPDIYCKVNFPEISYNSEVIFVKSSGKEYEMNLSGFIGYIQIEEEVFKRIGEGKDRGKYEKIIVHSTCFKEINKALINNNNFSEIRLGAIKYMVHEGYDPFRYTSDDIEM